MVEVCEMNLFNNIIDNFYKENEFLVVKKENNKTIIDEQFEFGEKNKEEEISESVETIRERIKIKYDLFNYQFYNASEAENRLLDLAKKYNVQDVLDRRFKIDDSFFDLLDLDRSFQGEKTVMDAIRDFGILNEKTMVGENILRYDTKSILLGDYKSYDLIYPLKNPSVMFRTLTKIFHISKDSIYIRTKVKATNKKLNIEICKDGVMEFSYLKDDGLGFDTYYPIHIYRSDGSCINKKYLNKHEDLKDVVESITKQKIDLNFNASTKIEKDNLYAEYYADEENNSYCLNLKDVIDGNKIELFYYEDLDKNGHAVYINKLTYGDFQLYIDYKNSYARVQNRDKCYLLVRNGDVIIHNMEDYDLDTIFEKIVGYRIDMSELYNSFFYSPGWSYKEILHSSYVIFKLFSSELKDCKDRSIQFPESIFPGYTHSKEMFELHLRCVSNDRHKKSDNNEDSLGKIVKFDTMDHPQFENIKLDISVELALGGYKKVINFIGKAGKTINTLIKRVFANKTVVTTVKHDGSFEEKVFPKKESPKDSIIYDAYKIMKNRSFVIGWKGCKTKDGKFAVVKLRIPNTSKLDTQSGTKFRTDKCTPIAIYKLEVYKCYRCKSPALGIDIKDRLVCEGCVNIKDIKEVFNFDKMTQIDCAYSCVYNGKKFKYSLNQPIEIKGFRARSIDCGVGIHFFKEPERLLRYCFSDVSEYSLSTEDHKKYLSVY